MVAIGVAMRRQVCWHGFACNLTTDLNFFRNINPCGMSSDLVTRWDDHAPVTSMKAYALEMSERFSGMERLVQQNDDNHRKIVELQRILG